MKYAVHTDAYGKSFVNKILKFSDTDQFTYKYVYEFKLTAFFVPEHYCKFQCNLYVKVGGIECKHIFTVRKFSIQAAIRELTERRMPENLNIHEIGVITHVDSGSRAAISANMT